MDFPPDVERSHRQDLANFGEPLPDEMVNKPKLKPGLALYLNAWYELDGERHREEYEYIRRSDCFDYANDYELSWTQTVDLWFFIRKLDRVFFEWYKKKAPKQKTPPHLAPRHRRR